MYSCNHRYNIHFTEKFDFINVRISKKLIYLLI